MFNKVIMMGRLVTDPELRTTPQGVNVCSFRIAVDRRFQQKGEEKKSDFFNVVAWRQQADFVHRYFTKGRLILVEGEMTTRPIAYPSPAKNRRAAPTMIMPRLHRPHLLPRLRLPPPRHSRVPQWISPPHPRTTTHSNAIRLT